MESEGALLEQANTRLGTVLCGKYTVDRVLGVGGMAVVYAATHRNQKRVAIKMLHPELSLHAEIRKRFLREGYVANSVKHRGAVDVIDDDVAEDGAAFIVMEYLDGAPLDAIADKHGGRMPPAAALVVAYELCAVLSAAHAREIVHRDIKPANIFVTKEGELKVLDFGIARLRDSSSGQATNTGMMLGTPAFMAPEQARGQTADIGPATDIWAAGATLFTLLSGANVHDADTAQMMMIQAATSVPRSLASVMPGLPVEVIHVVDKALKFDRKERWESAAAMRLALRDAHVGAFGDLWVARTLAPLVGGTAPQASDQDSASSRGVLGSASTVMTPAPALAPGARAVTGATTAFPVTSSFVTPIASKKSVGAVVAVVAILAGGAAIAMSMKSKEQPSAGSALVQSTPTATTTASMVEPPKPSAVPELKLQPLNPTPSASASTMPVPPGAPPVVAPAIAANRNPRASAPVAPVVDPKAPATVSAAAPPTASSAPPPRPPPPPTDLGGVR